MADLESAEPTEKAIALLSTQISQAWLANAERFYPLAAEGPDPKVMAEVAARCAWAFFLEVIQSAQAVSG